MSHERDIDRLAEQIQALRIEYERFFNGAVTVPPEALREQIQGQLRQLRNSHLQDAAETFRLGSLEARFNSFSEMYQRRLKDREEGRGPVRIPTAEPATRHDVRQGVLIGDHLEDDAVEALYSGLHQSAGPAPRFDLGSFRTYLERQVATIRQKSGAQSVQFRLEEEDGRMKLKAKPVAPRQSPFTKGA
jgi:hypothetical protein